MGDTSAPAVAYNDDADQYLVVYQTASGRLEGQLRDADGTLIDTITAVLPHTVGATIYREPRITYRSGDGQYVMTAVLERPGFIPTIDVTVTALDEDANLMWTYDVPGYVDTTARTPDVMADTFSTCCTLVTWKQSYGSIFGQLYNADGTTRGSRINIYVDGGVNSAHAFNPRIAYQRSPGDRFAVVYQLARNGMPGLLRVQTVGAYSGVLGSTVDIATMDADPWPRFGEKFPGGADIAYDEVGARYYVAWKDEDRIYLKRPGPDLTGGSTHIVFQDIPASGYFAQADGNIPEVTVATGFGKAYVTHPLRLDHAFGIGSPAHFVSGWWFSATGIFPASALSDWWYSESADNVVAAFSPVTDTVFGVWERDEPVFPIGPNDLYYELEDVP